MSTERATQNSPLDSLLWRLALKLTGLPLLELGGPLSRGGGSSADPRGRLDLSFGLEVHCKQVTLCLTSQERGRRGAILEAERRQKSAKLTHRRQKKRHFSPVQSEHGLTQDAQSDHESDAGVGLQPLSPLSDITAAKPLTGLTSRMQHFFFSTFS